MQCVHQLTKNSRNTRCVQHVHVPSEPPEVLSIVGRLTVVIAIVAIAIVHRCLKQGDGVGR